MCVGLRVWVLVCAKNRKQFSVTSIQTRERKIENGPRQPSRKTLTQNLQLLLILSTQYPPTSYAARTGTRTRTRTRTHTLTRARVRILVRVRVLVPGLGSGPCPGSCRRHSLVCFDSPGTLLSACLPVCLPACLRH